jgi:hypothetical protein
MAKSSSILISLCLVATVGCAIWAQGEDPRGRRLRDRVEAEVVPAIEAFQQAYGRYPSDLAELDGEISAPLEAEIWYSRSEDGCTLTVVYTPSWPRLGRSSCTFAVPARAWTCYGYL